MFYDPIKHQALWTPFCHVVYQCHFTGIFGAGKHWDSWGFLPQDMPLAHILFCFKLIQLVVSSFVLSGSHLFSFVSHLHSYSYGPTDVSSFTSLPVIIIHHHSLKFFLLSLSPRNLGSKHMRTFVVQ